MPQGRLESGLPDTAGAKNWRGSLRRANLAQRKTMARPAPGVYKASSSSEI